MHNSSLFDVIESFSFVMKFSMKFIILVFFKMFMCLKDTLVSEFCFDQGKKIVVIRYLINIIY